MLLIAVFTHNWQITEFIAERKHQIVALGCTREKGVEERNKADWYLKKKEK
jgi:hypothetical protein